jgi:hypothetical protein
VSCQRGRSQLADVSSVRVCAFDRGG